MAILGNNFNKTNFFMMRNSYQNTGSSNATNGTNNTPSVNNEQEVEQKAAVRVTEEDFNMNYDNYEGWIYYVQNNGIAHAKRIKKGRCVEVRFCPPEQAEKL